MNEPIDKVLNLIASRLKNRNIQVIQNNEDIRIIGLKNEFIQVILNILNNSIDAFENKNNTDKFIFIDLYKQETTAILTIKDNADGIKKDIINRVFEPYFTTKHKSQGTGIGLYMSMEIIQKHMNGKISVSNEEYIYENINCKGAQFKIELPIKD
jgi:signal transduction histidine kinase